MNDYENPMIGPLTDKEEWEMLTDEEIEALPKCQGCGEPVLGKYRNTQMHKICWQEGKAEYDKGENDG